MTTFVPDTSCMIAAVCTWHEHHAAAVNEVELRLGRGETMRIAAPTLVETYAVLTRLPSPYRLTATDALALVEANFVRARVIIALDGQAYANLLHHCRDNGIRGGQIYDAVIGECARQAQATALLTFNKGHFLPLAEHGVEIIVPRQSTG